MFRTRWIAAIVAVMTLASWAIGQDAAQKPTLKWGDPAPALACGKWIKGEPVAKLEKDKIYVVEFWATWCGPCRQSIPHVSEMQAKYKDVTFIGQNCWERDEASVEPFVKEMGDKMSYRVALDSAAGNEGAMAKTWMAAAGQEGIPCAFLIDKQTQIAWIGHPMELEPILKRLVAGEYDVKKEAAKAAAVSDLEEKAKQAMQSGKFDDAVAACDELAKSQPDQAKMAKMIKFDLMRRKKDTAGANAVAAELLELGKDEWELLNQVAWVMVMPRGGMKDPDLALAEKLAARANELSGQKEPFVLHALARINHLKGKDDKAAEFETQAIEKADDPRMKDFLRKTLAEYQGTTKPATTQSAH